MKQWLGKKCFVFLLLAFFALSVFGREDRISDTVAISDLPVAAQQTLKLIKRGGPYPYEKDGRVFGNYERVLPKKKRGYYHEFTVDTPGAAGRGARRIVTGGEGKSREYYYTDDHYESFRRIRE